MKLRDLFERGEFVISGEVGPVKGAIPRDENFVPPCLMEARQLNGSAPVFDLDSVQLVKIAAGLQAGRDMAGNPLMYKPDMFIGAVVNPNFQPLELQLLKMRKKAEAGAEFFQTQAVYDDATVDAFVENAARFGRPVQLGVVVLKSPQMGAYMNRNVSGISVPQAWIDEIGAVAKGDRKQKAAEMTGRFIKKHKAKFQGVHIMPLGWTDIVPDILAHAEIASPRPAA
jgi:methylenetetrahydrofolate reductase (NADPH)